MFQVCLIDSLSPSLPSLDFLPPTLSIPPSLPLSPSLSPSLPLTSFSSSLFLFPPFLPLSLHDSMFPHLFTLIPLKDDVDLVPEFVANQGLNALVTVGRDADQTFQQYILKGIPHHTFIFSQPYTVYPLLHLSPQRLEKLLFMLMVCKG